MCQRKIKKKNPLYSFLAFLYQWIRCKCFSGKNEERGAAVSCEIHQFCDFLSKLEEVWINGLNLKLSHPTHNILLTACFGISSTWVHARREAKTWSQETVNFSAKQTQSLSNVSWHLRQPLHFDWSDTDTRASRFSSLASQIGWIEMTHSAQRLHILLCTSWAV